jgi:glycine cleavage system H protein
MSVEIPDDLRYTEDHEWLRVEGEEGVVGVTAYAATEMGDVVFVELPAVGSRFEMRQSFGVIESVKTASDLYSPVGGEVVAINDQLAEHPELVNDDPYGRGWMIRLKLADVAQADELKPPAEYGRLLETG